MSKTTGLGSSFFIGGYDLSGDVTALSGVNTPIATLDVTAINKSAHERLLGLADGAMSVNTVFNPATGQAQKVLSAMPRTDTIASFYVGNALGNAAASINAKEVSYAPTRAQDGMLSSVTELQANSYGLEWGYQLTAGVRTDTAATNGTGVVMTATGENYLKLPGTSGNYASTPDAAALDITGDIDIRVRVAMDDWTPTTDQCVLAKYNTTGNQRSYNLHVLTTGALNFQWSNDGTVQNTKTSTSTVSFTDGTAHWIRATLDVDNGATGNTVTFYTSEDGSTWTQLGNPVVTAGTTSIFASTAILELGSKQTGTAANAACKIFQAQVLNGIGGTVVANPVVGTSSITDSAGLTWTVNGASSYISAQTPYGLQAYLQVTAFTGTDVTIKLQSSADNGVLDAWSDITGASFTSVTTAPQAQRIATSATLPIEKYIRAVTTTSGGFTSCSFAVMYVRNKAAVSF